MIFVILRSRSSDTIQKAILVAEEIKRLRRRRWQEIDGDEELKQ